MLSDCFTADQLVVKNKVTTVRLQCLSRVGSSIVIFNNSICHNSSGPSICNDPSRPEFNNFTIYRSDRYTFTNPRYSFELKDNEINLTIIQFQFDDPPEFVCSYLTTSTSALYSVIVIGKLHTI